MQIILHKDRPYFNVAVLLVSAAGCSKQCFQIYFSYDEKWRRFARWFWSNEVKFDLISKINKAQGIDLEDWYWSNQ